MKKVFRLNQLKIFSGKKREVLIFIVWGLILGLITIKVYWVGYQEIKWLQHQRVAYGWYETPNPKIFDLILVLIAGIFLGVLISDVKFLFFGFIGGLFLAFVVGLTFVMYYMWAVLELKSLFSLNNFNWEWGFLFALFNVGKIIFPQIIFCSLVGIVMGAFLREQVGY